MRAALRVNRADDRTDESVGLGADADGAGGVSCSGVRTGLISSLSPDVIGAPSAQSPGCLALARRPSLGTLSPGRWSCRSTPLACVYRHTHLHIRHILSPHEIKRCRQVPSQVRSSSPEPRWESSEVTSPASSCGGAEISQPEPRISLWTHLFPPQGPAELMPRQGPLHSWMPLERA